MNSKSHAIVLAVHHKPVQEHDNEIPSVAIAIAGNMDKGRFDRWFDHLLQAQGADTFRMEGVLNFDGKAYGVIFQLGDMLFEDHSGRLRESERHESRLFFLGHNLDDDQLYKGLKSCQVRKDGVFCRSASLLLAAGDCIGSWFRVRFRHCEPADSKGGRRKCRVVPSS